MRKKLSLKEETYWSNVLISVSQVLFGVSAVTFFAGGIDLNKVNVIILTLILSIICWVSGWRLIK